MTREKVAVGFITFSLNFLLIKAFSFYIFFIFVDYFFHCLALKHMQITKQSYFPYRIAAIYLYFKDLYLEHPCNNHVMPIIGEQKSISEIRSNKQFSVSVLIVLEWKEGKNDSRNLWKKHIHSQQSVWKSVFSFKCGLENQTLFETFQQHPHLQASSLQKYFDVFIFEKLYLETVVQKACIFYNFIMRKKVNFFIFSFSNQITI